GIPLLHAINASYYAIKKNKKMKRRERPSLGIPVRNAALPLAIDGVVKKILALPDASENLM
ncbi:MAG: hypothetical protein MR717_06055, partial [Prevotella sp.]|nr:hypothetical protein [Prevotella sp.]